MQNGDSGDKIEAQLRAAFRAATERLSDEINNASQIIAIRLDLLRRNLNSRDEKSLNQWIDEIKDALRRIKVALEEHAKRP